MAEEPGGTGADLSDVLRRLLEASHRIAPDVLGELIVGAAIELGATSARVWLADHQQRNLVLLASGGALPAPPPDQAGGDGVWTAAISIEGTAAGRAYVMSGPVDAPLEGGGARHLWLPLLDGVDRIGVLELVVEDDRLGDRGDRHRFVELCSVATAEIVSRGQYSDRFTRLRRMRPMTLSAELQWQQLPPGTFRVSDVAVAGMLEPAYEVGGDTFDYAHSIGRLDFAIFDSVGHSLESSLISALALGAYRNSRREGADLIGCAAAIDAAIAQGIGKASFATAILGRLDTGSGEMTWLNAGHPHPLLVRGSHLGELPSASQLPLGLGHLGGERMWTTTTRQLEPGDGVVLYTDGVVEAQAPGGEQFGVERLKEFVHTAFAAEMPPAETLRRLSRAILDFHEETLRDDAATFLVVWRP